jgi:hypothetical protein
VAKLVVNPTSANRREIALGRTLLCIGRDPSNDLVLPDAMVSRRHAVIEYRGSQYFLRDCNSSNGSVINGDRVSERGLRDGDMVAIGSARLLFKEEIEGELAAKVVPHPSSPRFSCPSCEGQYRKGDVFCRTCGGKLPEPSGPPKAVCTACGTAVLLPAHFCSACGAKLPAPSPDQGEPATGSGPIPGLAPGAAASEPRAASGGASSPEPRAEAGPASAGAGPERREAAPPADPIASAGRGEGGGIVPVGEGSGAGSGPPREPRSEGALARAAGAPASASLFEAELRRPASARAFTPEPEPDARRRAQTEAVRVAEAAPPPPASAGVRALAALLDVGLVAGTEALILVPLGSYWWSREVPRTVDDVLYLPVLLSLVAVPLALAVAAGYYLWSWGSRGATLGQRLLDLAVEGEDGRFPIGLGKAAVRLFGYLLSALSLGVGFLLVPLTGAGLHDRMAGTRVVRRRAGAIT